MKNGRYYLYGVLLGQLLGLAVIFGTLFVAYPYRDALGKWLFTSAEQADKETIQDKAYEDAAAWLRAVLTRDNPGCEVCLSRAWSTLEMKCGSHALSEVGVRSAIFPAKGLPNEIKTTRFYVIDGQPVERP